MATKFRLSPAQTTYAKALAAYETVMAEYSHRVATETPPLTPDMTEEEMLASYEADEHIATELNVHGFCRLLQQAEDVLIAWGYDYIKQFPQYADKKADLDRLYTVGARNLKVRKQLLDLTFRLSA